MKQQDILVAALLALLFFNRNKRKKQTEGSAAIVYLVAPFVENGMYSAGVQVADTWHIVDVPAGSFDRKTINAGNYLVEILGYGDAGYTLTIYDTDGTLVDFYGYTNEGIEVAPQDVVSYFS